MHPFGFGRFALASMVAAGLLVPSLAEAQRVRDGRSRTPVDRNDRNDDDDRAPKETEQVDRTIAVPANGTLRLKNFSGNVRIVAGSGRDIVMKATRRASRERLDRVKLDVSTSGSTVTIEANQRVESNRERNNNVVDTTFELQVPASINLDVEVFSSDVTVDGVTGEQKIHSFSGEIDVMNPRGSVDAETFSADIRMTVSRDARGSVSFSTFSGEVDTALAISTTSWRKRDVEGTLPGGAGPRMKFHTFSGDLKISSR
jgi:hypothetical protein